MLTLKREARRNLELIWLLRGLVPGYRMIADFRKENGAALKATNREFVLLARELELVDGEVVAIDSAFFHGDAGKTSIIATRCKLARQLAALEHDIEAYASTLETNDAAESAQMPASVDHGGAANAAMAEKLAGLLAGRTRVEAELAWLEESGQTQLSLTDADARLLTKSGQTVAGYNVQVAVDDKAQADCRQRGGQRRQ